MNDKPCITLNGSGIEVIFAIACVTIIVVVSIIFLKENSKDIVLTSVAALAGWLGKTVKDKITDTDPDRITQAHKLLDGDKQ
jgi:hypothetical protein